jgi:dolichol-phosphate mannosyltransferase
VQRLRSGEDPLRLARFLVVGVTTLFINSLLLAFWTEVAGIYYLISAALATQGATVCGFCMTEFWVFPERRSRRGRIPRFVKFLLMNNVVLALRGPLLYVLTSGLGLHYLVSNVISVGVLTLIRYALADTWIWRKARPTEAGPASGFHSLADLD